MLGTNTQARLKLAHARLHRGRRDRRRWPRSPAYFHLFGGFSDSFCSTSRARGTFNDPNVLGAFLVLPGLLAVPAHAGRAGFRMIGNGAAPAVLLAALFLSFSRGAWGQFAFAAVLMGPTFITSRSPEERFAHCRAWRSSGLSLSRCSWPRFCRSARSPTCSISAPPRTKLRPWPLRPFRPLYSGRRTGARASARHRPVAVRAFSSRRPAQHLPQHVHVGRLARRLAYLTLTLVTLVIGLRASSGGDALAADLPGRLRRLCRRRARAPSSTSTTGATISYPRRAVGPDGAVAAISRPSLRDGPVGTAIASARPLRPGRAQRIVRAIGGA